MLKMICTDDGYAITDEFGMEFATFSIEAGKSIYLDMRCRNPERDSRCSNAAISLAFWWPDSAK